MRQRQNDTPMPPLQATTRRVDNEMGTTTTTTTTMKKWYTMHIQPHKALLMGWFICGMVTMMMTTSNNSKTMKQ
jgi:hypothetical protein